MKSNDDVTQERETAQEREERGQDEHGRWLSRLLAGEDPNAPLADDDDDDEEGER